ncbi:MAG: acyl carrier protein [Moraxellaceae bacterium]|nr:acyl carrier protein [Moraxellaceae bacterium]
MNSEKTIEERLKSVIEEKFGLGVEIKPSTRFVEDLHFDSQDTLDLIMGLEEEFTIEIPDEDAEKFTTVQSVIDYVTNKG